MLPYGLNRLEVGDVDCLGCSLHGRATHIYNIKKRAYHSLRNGKKAINRRRFKKRERTHARADLVNQLDSGKGV
jgi:hypothetical protein